MSVSDNIIGFGLKTQEKVMGYIEKFERAEIGSGVSPEQAKAEAVNIAIEHLARKLYEIRDNAVDGLKEGNHFQMDNSTVFEITRQKGTFTSFEWVKIERPSEEPQKGSPVEVLEGLMKGLGAEIMDVVKRGHTEVMASAGVGTHEAFVGVITFVLDTVAKPIYKLKDEYFEMKPQEWVDSSGRKWVASPISEKTVKIRPFSYMRTKIAIIDGKSSSGRLSIKRAENELGKNYIVVNNK